VAPAAARTLTGAAAGAPVTQPRAARTRALLARGGGAVRLGARGRLVRVLRRRAGAHARGAARYLCRPGDPLPPPLPPPPHHHPPIPPLRSAAPSIYSVSSCRLDLLHHYFTAPSLLLHYSHPTCPRRRARPWAPSSRQSWLRNASGCARCVARSRPPRSGGKRCSSTNPSPNPNPSPSPSPSPSPNPSPSPSPSPSPNPYPNPNQASDAARA
jgi:hypothetical protein